MIPDDGPWEIAFDRTGSRIVSTNALWDTETGEQVMALPRDREAGRVAFSPDGSRFARASFTGGVALFDAQTGEQLFTLDGDCAVAGVDFSPDGSRLVTVDGCYTMKVWAHDIDDLLRSRAPSGSPGRSPTRSAVSTSTSRPVLPRSLRRRRGHARCTTSPSTIVCVTRTSSRRRGSAAAAANTSSLSTTRSACFPGEIEPRRSSANTTWAPPIV